MRALRVITLVLLLTTAVVKGEDPKPDFSGTWRLNREKSRLETIVPEHAELLFVIEHDDPRFRMIRTANLNQRSDTLSWEATTDGKEHHRKEGDLESWMRMNWMGDELVLKSRLERRGERGTNEAHYRLTDEGRTLGAAEWFHMPNSIHHNLWVFDKKP